MAKEKLHEMPITRGSYQVKGITKGVQKPTFYTEKKTKTDKDFRSINFGVEYNTNKTVYMSLNGMIRDKVYFSKKDDKNKTVIKSVPWTNRVNGTTDGFRMIGGVNIGLTKTTDSNGNLVNNKKILVEYDACSYINQTMKDDMSVFVRGQMEFSSFVNKNGDISRSTKFVPNQISLCKEVDFESEDYNETHDFTQTIVFMGIEQEKVEEKPTGRFVVEAKIVNYNSIESAEFIVEDVKFANQLRKGLKPYWAIEVHGKINVVNVIETVENDDCWGDDNPMERVAAPTKRELVITGAKPSTIDKESYIEEKINDAIRKQNVSRAAEENFNGKADKSNDDSWNVDDGFEEEDVDW